MTRSNFTIYDEVAVMKKTSIDEIFEGMLFPRQPVYLNKYPEYISNPRWLEESKSVYLTSSKFKYQWWFKEWKNCVTGYYIDKVTKYNVFASDYFDNIDNNLKTWGDFKRAKSRMNELTFRMEMLNEAVGESEDAFFSYSMFKDNQILEKCFRPPTDSQFLANINLKNVPKNSDKEIRLVVVDFAFANTTSREKNDSTSIHLVSGHWKGNYFERHWDYITPFEASDSLNAARYVRQLYYDYEADYIVMDKNNGGETLYNSFTEIWHHPYRGNRWNPHGMTVSNRPELHVLPDNKIQDFKNRTVDKEAIPCIIPIGGTAELNSSMWYCLKKELEYGHCKFLISEKDYQETLENSGEYFNLTSEEYAEKVFPYIQTEMLIYEALSLEATYTNEKVKLSTKRSMTKDMVVVMSYANYIISKIENQWNKSKQEEKIDIEDIDFVW